MYIKSLSTRSQVLEFSTQNIKNEQNVIEKLIENSNIQEIIKLLSKEFTKEVKWLVYDFTIDLYNNKKQYELAETLLKKLIDIENDPWIKNDYCFDLFICQIQLAKNDEIIHETSPKINVRGFEFDYNLWVFLNKRLYSQMLVDDINNVAENSSTTIAHEVSNYFQKSLRDAYIQHKEKTGGVTKKDLISLKKIYGRAISEIEMEKLQKMKALAYLLNSKMISFFYEHTEKENLLAKSIPVDKIGKNKIDISSEYLKSIRKFVNKVMINNFINLFPENKNKNNDSVLIGMLDDKATFFDNLSVFSIYPLIQDKSKIPEDLYKKIVFYNSVFYNPVKEVHEIYRDAIKKCKKDQFDIILNYALFLLIHREKGQKFYDEASKMLNAVLKNKEKVSGFNYLLSLFSLKLITVERNLDDVKSLPAPFIDLYRKLIETLFADKKVKYNPSISAEQNINVLIKKVGEKVAFSDIRIMFLQRYAFLIE